MKQPAADLFPETLLVNLDGIGIYTTSLKVAEYFGKRHADVIRAIEQILADLTIPPLAHPTFDPYTLLDNDPTMAGILYDLDGGPASCFGVRKGGDHERTFALMMHKVKIGKGALRDEKIYRLSHDGFALLAMGFSGRRALVWKLKFLQAFRQMEAQINVMRNRYVSALDILCPPLRPTVERTQDDQDRISIASVIGKSCASVSYYRAKARRLGLLGGRS